MSETNIQPLIESAILTLEQILENKNRMACIDLYNAPGANHIYAEHNQVLHLKIGLCANIRINQVNNLGIDQLDPRITKFTIMFDEIASQWSKSSGLNYYPVPMPEHFNQDWERYSEPDKELDEHSEQEKAYAAYHTCIDECVNMYANDYGELRFQLAEFVLKKLE